MFNPISQAVFDRKTNTVIGVQTDPFAHGDNKSGVRRDQVLSFFRLEKIYLNAVFFGLAHHQPLT